MKKLLIYVAVLVFFPVFAISANAQETEKSTGKTATKESSDAFSVSKAKMMADKYKVVSDMRNYNFDFDQSQRSELTLMKKFEGESVNTTKTFDVEKSFIAISLYGTAESGKLSIKLLTPDGKEFKNFEIDPASDVSWNVKLDANKDDKYVGKWTIQVTVEKAKGFYSLRIMSGQG